MRDGQGRTIDYMRISITDRCNLRCRYCMPFGIDPLPLEDILCFEEIQAAAFCAAGLGIRHLKVTGGEPLVRRDCCRLVNMLKAVPGIEKVTITTNGVLLGQYLDQLEEAGIDGINVSLDTLDPERYRSLTGRDCLDSVLEALKRAAARIPSVKVNAVSLDLGQENWIGLTELAAQMPVDVRFIEMMPIGYGREFPALDHRVLLEEMGKRYPGMEEDHTQHGYGPAVYYRIPGFQGSIGFISAIHGKFCSSCNRVRLTSQGYLKTCLCYEDGTDLRAVLREGQKSGTGRGHYCWPEGLRPDDRELQKRLRAAFEKALMKKPAAHCFEDPAGITESGNMVSIGG